MSQLKAVLFDLDGTLIDTAPDFVRVLNLLRAEQNLPPLPDEAIRAQVSNGARALIKLGFNLTEDDEHFQKRLDRLLELYLDGLAIHSDLFAGLNNTLNLLESRRIPWGIVTNKPSRYTTPLLERLDLHTRCAVTVCPDQVTHKKPHPEPLLLACQQLGVSPQQTLYIGDHIRDIEAGRRAGNKTVAAAWGYIEPDDSPTLWGADYLAASPEMLLQFILKLL